MTTTAESRDLHRPATVDERRPAVLALLRQGLRPLDVAACLRVPLAEVLEVERTAGEGAPG